MHALYHCCAQFLHKLHACEALCCRVCYISVSRVYSICWLARIIRNSGNLPEEEGGSPTQERFQAQQAAEEMEEKPWGESQDLGRQVGCMFSYIN